MNLSTGEFCFPTIKEGRNSAMRNHKTSQLGERKIAITMNESLYFAYGSNMNLDQMAHRCPRASVLGVYRVDDYRLAFCGNQGAGVATILPEPGSQVTGVLWRITDDCLRSLDRYEGYPLLYGKEEIRVYGPGRVPQTVMVYTMNEPYRSCPAPPSRGYLMGILEGCRQNGISTKRIHDAVRETTEAVREATPTQQTLFRVKRRNQER